MKVIIAGSRNPQYSFLLIDAIVMYSGFEITEVVSGCMTGIDNAGEEYARKRKIPIKQFPADWNEYGKKAGPIRNQQMANYADALIAIPSISSKGTYDMINKAKAKGLKVFISDALM